MTKPSDMIKTDKYANCADLDSPALFIIMDFKWARENEAAIRSCKGVYGFSLQDGMFLILKARDRLLFALRWP